MGKYIGVWKLDEPLYCRKEVSGKHFCSTIAGVPVVLLFLASQTHLMEKTRPFLRVI